MDRTNKLTIDGATRLYMNEPAVLLLSMRRVAKLVGFCSVYEFEDVMQSLTGAERVDAAHSTALELSRRAYKYTRLSTGSQWLAQALTPAPSAIRLRRDYDLFFAVFNHPHELYTLASLPDWRKRCTLAACYIDELWTHLLPRYLLELLAKFDWIFLGCCNVVDEVTRLTGKHCTYLPLGVDVLNFAPDPNLSTRAIDVCNIGRRSQSTHDALLSLARQQQAFFYYYDTAAASGADLKQRTFNVENPREHRLLLASLLRRSRYYIANRARVNEQAFTAHGDEISSRFYEGVAAGTVMLGEAPRGDEFKRQFDWPDALIPLPFDAPHIGAVLRNLDGDPERLARIRRDNVHQAALRHDWVYRIRTIFTALGLPATQPMLARERQLQTLASLTRNSGAIHRTPTNQGAVAIHS